MIELYVTIEKDKYGFYSGEVVKISECYFQSKIIQKLINII
ncbi:hypothetical protein HNP65_001839 [Thermosipho japonicus]|uniref:Uncharacterized protein n=1 Tax=Thermosipho japonicus TaxID=90323 RepID=A0A841GTQ2_9BACT|nr:hypothetical protein [Thermosipho japonicus]MBB6063369.1 hypothetical protein [Thermosipho japonicus]